MNEIFSGYMIRISIIVTYFYNRDVFFCVADARGTSWSPRIGNACIRDGQRSEWKLCRVLEPCGI